MFDQIKSLLGFDESETATEEPTVLDKNLAAAALMVHVIAADGEITDEEEAKLNQVLHNHYALSDTEAKSLANQAKFAQSSATDLYGFTSLLKRDMSEDERILLVEDLWEMVFADGSVHEFEDNVVWRVAELLGVHSRHRMTLKQRVMGRIEEAND
ncbi:MAG: TerB family tellurite resistance protein [Pseudomonadota bacterium]